ncbi:MAG TPA: flagellar biosynthetic protein FliR [Candidatus Limnocylindrales bacterium]
MTYTIAAGQTSMLFLVMLRCTGLVMTAPIFGHHSVPYLVKFGFAAALTVALCKTAGATAGTMPVLMAAPIEILIGTSLGFILTMGFQAVEIAGRVISIQLGLSLASVFSPTEEEAATAIDPFFSVLAGLTFLAMGLHLAIVQALAHSFVMYPVGGGWPADLAMTGAQTISLALELGVRVALPIALVLLLTELAVALLARAIPQINVFILGLPLKMLVGMVVLGLAMPSLVSGTMSIFRFVFGAATGGAVST